MRNIMQEDENVNKDDHVTPVVEEDSEIEYEDGVDEDGGSGLDVNQKVKKLKEEIKKMKEIETRDYGEYLKNLLSPHFSPHLIVLIWRWEMRKRGKKLIRTGESEWNIFTNNSKMFLMNTK